MGANGSDGSNVSNGADSGDRPGSHEVGPVGPASRLPFELPLTPMLAAAGPLPDTDAWAYEMKWDGVRVVAHVRADGSVRLWSRAGNDVTAGYPELAEFTGGHDLVLDGEIIALDDNGIPSFGRLQQRMHVRDLASIVRLVATVPVEARLFDCLAVDGQSLLRTPLRRRRALLESLDREVLWELSPVEADGGALLARSEAAGMEGVVAKRWTSAYQPGARSPDWIKVKHTQTRDAIIVGWHPGEGSRAGGIGSLYLAANHVGALRLIGKVGSGLNQEMLALLGAELLALETPEPPCDVSAVAGRERRAAHWLEPLLVCEVAHQGWSHEYKLRSPVWRGLRFDVDPDDVTVEWT